MPRPFIIITGTVFILLAIILLGSFGHVRNAISAGSEIIQSHIPASKFSSVWHSSALIPPKHHNGTKLHIAFYTGGLGAGYFRWAYEFLESATEHFCKNDFVQVDYFIFSNHPAPANFPANYHVLPVVERGWPHDSQDKFIWIHEHATANPDYDYILWMDAAQRFERPICFDLLGELVAVAHPHYYDGVTSHFPYESHVESKAYIPFDNARVQQYYSSNFFGGTYAKILSATKTIYDWMEEDLIKGFHARMKDESYLNAYFYYNFPTAVLSRIFVWPDGYENQMSLMLDRHGGRSEAAAVARYMANKPHEDDL